MESTSVADAEAVRRVLEGDRDAYRILVERHAPMVFRVVRRYCSDQAAAEDLAQNAFIRAYQNLRRFRGKAPFSAWLYQIAVNQGRDYAKSPRRSNYLLHDFNDPQQDIFPDNVPSGDLHLENGERAEHLRWAIGQLSPAYATPFLLRYDEGIAYPEMARMLGTTIGALKVRVHRARMELKKLLGDRL